MRPLARSASRRLLTRILPGGAIMVAAFAVPELSVGAGDLGAGEGRADPTEPMAKRGVNPRNTSALQATSPALAGVRYASMIDLGLEAPRARATAATSAAPLAMPAEGGRAVATDSAAAPVGASAAAPTAPAFVPAPHAATTLAAPAGQGVAVSPGIEGPAVAAAGLTQAPPVAALAAVPMPQAAADLTAAELPVAPAIPTEERASLATVLPEEQTALRAPAGAAIAAPAPVAPAAAPMAQSTVPGGRGAMEQLTLARIAAARVVPPPTSAPVQQSPAARIAPPASLPAPAPARVAAPVAAKALAAAPVAARPAPSAPRAPVAAAAVVPKPAPALTAPPATLDIKSQLLTRVDGRTAGALDFQQTAAGLKVRLGSVVEVLADRYDAAQLARIRGSSAGNTWLSLAELQAQGVPISYDPVYDEFNIGKTDTRPKAARKVHMDQISAPERGLGATGMQQVRP